MNRAFRLATLVLAAAMAARAAEAAANPVTAWNLVATEAAAAHKTDPLTESRWFAILHLAVHDAVNAVQPRYETYRSHPGLRAEDAALDAAIAGAAHGVLTELQPAERARFDAALAAQLAGVPDGEAEDRGLELGRAVARELLAARADDGAARTIDDPPGTRPGEYRPTPPDLTPAFCAHWGRVAPFALTAPDQFRPGPPPTPGGPQALAELAEVREIGDQRSATRTAEQTEIAKYWYENSTQGWNRIARVLAESRGLDPWQSARFYALVNVAMADGFIGGFEAKYHYRYWRPVTAIREAGHGDWLSHLWTPPVPDHPSTHTVLGAAAATAMARYFGTDFVSFEMTSGNDYSGITRRFWSLSAAARENGASRVLAGIHFPTAVRAGYEQGERIGNWVAERILRPLAPTTTAPEMRAAAGH